MGYAPQVDEAIRLNDQNDKAGAQRILARYLQANPRDEEAWLWLAYILPNRLQQQQALKQCLKYFPGSLKAQRSLDSLRMGIPLSRPPQPSDASSSAASFSRDLFAPDPDASAKTPAEAPRQTGSLTGAEPAPYIPSFLDEPEPEDAAPLDYPIHAVDSFAGLEWLREEALTPAPASQPVPPVYPRIAPPPTPRAVRSKPTRKKSNGFSGWQIGCITLLILIILATVCGGIYYIFSRPPMSNLLPCFEAVLANEYPCAACPSAAQDCPECPQPQECTPAAALPYPPAATPAAQPEVTAAPAAVETAEPAVTPTEIPAAGPSLSLPAPLYFLSEDGGSAQIWRLAQDGSLSVVTTETAPITAFDVSPLDGRLAYVSSNSLYLAGADGTGRVSLLTGQDLPGVDDPTYWSVLVSAPVWSADGTQLAFSQDGVQVIQPLTGDLKRLVSNVTVPEKPNLRLVYAPLSWSPDSLRLAVSMTQEACTNLGILSTQGEGSLDLEAVPAGSPVWIHDSASLLIANPSLNCACQRDAGLYQVDPLSGNTQALQGGLPTESAPSVYIGYPKLMADGTLLYFYGELPASACEPGSTAAALLSMVVGVGERWDLRMPLRSDSHLIGEALWSADGSLAVIRDQTLAAEGRFGPLLILYSDGSPAVEIPVTGRSLHWGVPAP